MVYLSDWSHTLSQSLQNKTSGQVHKGKFYQSFHSPLNLYHLPIILNPLPQHGGEDHSDVHQEGVVPEVVEVQADFVGIAGHVRARVHEPTNKARAEPSLLELCLARRRKTEG